MFLNFKKAYFTKWLLIKIVFVEFDLLFRYETVVLAFIQLNSEFCKVPSSTAAMAD